MDVENQEYIVANSLFISILALNSIRVPLENEKISDVNKTSFSTLTLAKFNISEFKSYFSNYEVQQTIKPFLITLTNILQQPIEKVDISIERQRIKQYLRRFSFLYQSFVLKTYPNDLSEINYYKINMLAIKNLYILNNL